MEDMDFTREPSASQPAAPAAASAPFKAAHSRYYDAAIASRLFQAAGKVERVASGQVIFAEAQKASSGGLFSRPASRMYFLAEGEVALTIGERRLDTVKPQEVFGEMAVITGRPRSATATAGSDCTLYSVSEDELRNAFAGAPEFALMLMSVMFDRLRFVGTRLVQRGAAISRREDIQVFEPALLKQLEDVLVRPMLTQYQQGASIMREGQAGMVMYVVKEGRVAITLGGNVVESVGPGGSFGEIALVDQSPRTASASAEQWCELLAVDRASLLEAVRQQPAFAMAMLRGIADRLRHLNSQAG